MSQDGINHTCIKHGPYQLHQSCLACMQTMFIQGAPQVVREPSAGESERKLLLAIAEAAASYRDSTFDPEGLEQEHVVKLFEAIDAWRESQKGERG